MTSDAEIILAQLRAKNRDRVRRHRARKAAAAAIKARKMARSVALRAKKRTMLLEKRKKAARAKKRQQFRAERIQAEIARKEKRDVAIAALES